MKQNNEFTLQDAIQIQNEQLDEWKQVLKVDVWNKLYKFAKEGNLDISKNPIDAVKRGTQLMQFVCTLMDEYRNNKIEK